MHVKCKNFKVVEEDGCPGQERQRSMEAFSPIKAQAVVGERGMVYNPLNSLG